MDVPDLMRYWEKHAGVGNTAREFTVRLPMHDAARVLALADMYSAETEAPIIAELLGAAQRTAGSLPLQPASRGHRQR
ncbi:MAG: hypothetical protein P8164_11345 [Gammaproteobacteria bacterium]|jgi:hypothetical protein